MQKPTVFPIFLECLSYTLDPYWQQVFEDCSRGKFPKGSGIDSSGNSVFFKSQTNNAQSFKLEKEPELLFKQLKELFNTKLGMRSKKDRSNICEEIEVLKEQLELLYTGTWTSIRKKSIKDALIRNFVLELKELYSLDSTQTSQLKELLQIGFLFNWILPESVVYDDKKISEIKGLVYDESIKKFELDFDSNEKDNKKKKIKREFMSSSGKLSNLWKKNWESTRNKYKNEVE